MQADSARSAPIIRSKCMPPPDNAGIVATDTCRVKGGKLSTSKHHTAVVNALAKAGIELGENGSIRDRWQ